MANERHLALLGQGVETWNKYRKENLRERPYFRGAFLEEADLSGADFRGASFAEANLGHALLRKADLSGADLSGANLSGADIRGTNLEGVVPCYADMTNTKIDENTIFDDDIRLVWEILNQPKSDRDLKGADLHITKLDGARLRRANLEGADLSGTWLGKADLNEANLTRANLYGVHFWETNLVEANLKEANLEEAELWEANLTGANLEGANLEEAELNGANLSGASLEGAILTGACIEDWQINNDTNFDGVICKCVYLKEGKQERRPHDPSQNFQPGEFAFFIESMRAAKPPSPLFP